ncbi:MAG: class I SAM-dependent DNA methyltransferase, partial [Gammaproteobacteria bacterium]|nr:class I SAM-dependent DNA methyltransferase [Gammaproteobacteria bacterium]
MDANRYTPIGVVSPAEGLTQPEILLEAKQGFIDPQWNADNARIMGLLDGSIASDAPQSEAYQLLLIAVCNSYHSKMPFLFERIADYTELLIPDDLLSDSSILSAMRQVMTNEACQSVEIIGWLYQFYISEKKDEVIGKVVKSEDIPAATQLFTPNWIVKYMVQNSLGAQWLATYPQSPLKGQMEYYIEPAEQTDEVNAQL